jgi:hypothetical protein
MTPELGKIVVCLCGRYGGSDQGKSFGAKKVYKI